MRGNFILPRYLTLKSFDIAILSLLTELIRKRIRHIIIIM